MKILITGGSGTVGSFICRQLSELGHHPVVFARDYSLMVDRCPDAEHVVGDIQDYHSVLQAIREHEVEGVIHAAANKHVLKCEVLPMHAVAVNVVGSLNVLKALWDTKDQVKTTVMVSTDKACNSDQIYGITKYLMERMTTEQSLHVDSTLRTVRFGNVLGSSGSVFVRWRDALNKGQPIKLLTIRGQTPQRLVMLPSEAAALCVKVLLSDLECGLFVPVSLPTVNIARLAFAMRAVLCPHAEVVTEDTDSVESVREGLLGPDESNGVRHENIWQVTDGGRECAKDLPSSRVLDYEQTVELVRNVLKEVGNGH